MFTLEKSFSAGTGWNDHLEQQVKGGGSKWLNSAHTVFSAEKMYSLIPCWTMWLLGSATANSLAKNQAALYRVFRPRMGVKIQQRPVLLFLTPLRPQAPLPLPWPPNTSVLLSPTSLLLSTARTCSGGHQAGGGTSRTAFRLVLLYDALPYPAPAC